MWGGADNVWSIRYAEHGYRLTCQIAKQHIQNAYHKLNSEKCALPSVTQLETQLSRTSWHDTSTCRVRTYGLLLPHSLVHVNLELGARHAFVSARTVGGAGRGHEFKNKPCSSPQADSGFTGILPVPRNT